jgi:hypothetical protein
VARNTNIKLTHLVIQQVRFGSYSAFAEKTKGSTDPYFVGAVRAAQWAQRFVESLLILVDKTEQLKPNVQKE